MKELKVGLVLSAVDKMSRVISSAVDKSTIKMKKLESASKSLSLMSNKIFIAGGLAAAGIMKTIKEAEAGSTAQARLDNVFKSMWGNSKAVREVSKAQGELAEKMALQVGIDEDTIKLAQAKIATFQHVSSKAAVMSGVFERATRAAVDLSAAGFGDAATSAVMLGKALEDPYNMATALKRTGSLTDKDVVDIKAVYATKGLAEAQEMLLKAVERQVKGTAAATANGTDIIKVGFMQVVEEIGNSFLPAVEQAKNGTLGFVEKAKTWIRSNQELIRTITKIGAVLLAVAAIMKIVALTSKAISVAITVFNALKFAVFAVRYAFVAYNVVQKTGAIVTGILTAAQWAYNVALNACPVMWIITAIGALIGVLIWAWNKFESFRAIVKTTWEVLKKFGSSIWTYVTSRIKELINAIGLLGESISFLFKGEFEKAGQAAKSAVVKLAGVETKINLMKEHVAIVKQMPTIYSDKLSKESSVTVPQQISNENKSISKNQSVVYSPQITINGGTTKDKEEFSKLLKEHSYDLENIMNSIEKNKLRLSY